MNPLPDRTVILVLVITVLLCFALAFWTARLQPPRAEPMQWRDTPSQPSRPALPADGA